MIYKLDNGGSGSLFLFDKTSLDFASLFTCSTRLDYVDGKIVFNNASTIYLEPNLTFLKNALKDEATYSKIAEKFHLYCEPKKNRICI